MPKLQICLRHTSRLLINRVLCVFPHAFQRMQSLCRLSLRPATAMLAFASISFSYFFRWHSPNGRIILFRNFSLTLFAFDTVFFWGAPLLPPRRPVACKDRKIQKSVLAKHFWLFFTATVQPLAFVCHLYFLSIYFF